MTRIRYYPLIDCDSEGTEKFPMFPTNDPVTIQWQSPMWLEEMVPHYFRLATRDSDVTMDNFLIRCPKCGEPLKQIGKSIDTTRHGLYVCDRCHNN